MEQSEIKKQADLLYSNIEKAQKGLQQLREICKHPNEIKTNYSYRVGVIMPAMICADCGKLIHYID